MTTTDSSAGRGRWKGRALLATALCLLVIGGLLWWLNDSVGPATRRVNVRWQAGLTSDQRHEAERSLGLQDGVNAGSDTWMYILRDRSQVAIAALVGDSRVRDTHHIDREQHRIQLDPPNPADIHHPAEHLLLRLPWLLMPMEAEALAPTAAALAIVGALLLALARRTAIDTVWYLWAAVAFAARAVMRWGARAAAARDALDRRLGYTRSDRTPVSAVEYLAGLVLALLFLAPLLWLGPYEEEVIQHSIFPSQLFYRALFRGEWLSWVNDLGFGGPLPGDLLMLHPLAAPLLAFASTRTALSILWIAHTVPMAIYFLRLTALSQVRSSFLRLCLLAAYLWSAVGIVYYYDTDWITNAISWSLYPVLVFYLHAAVRSPSPLQLKDVIRLALLFAFWILNAHPGYIAPTVSVLIVYTVAIAPVRARVYAGLAASAALCVAANTAHLYALAHEAMLFPTGTAMVRQGASLQFFVEGALSLDRDRRGALIGLSFLTSALFAVFARSTWREPHVRGTATALIGAITLSVLPPYIVQWLAPSGSALFRDSYIFFGLLLAGTMLQRWVDRGLGWWVALLLACQVAQQGASVVGPGLVDFFDHKGRLLFYKYQGQSVGLGREVQDAARRFGRRVYLSPDVEFAIRGRLSRLGLHFSTDLALLGLNPVNAWFKNVAMSDIQPPTSMMESFISGNMNVVANQSLLDVLGINLVMIAAGENVPDFLTVVRSKSPIIAGNPHAWPKAVLLNHSAADLTLPVRAGCAHTAALCREYTPIRPLRLPDVVSLRERDGEFEASFAPSNEERILFISSLFRREWEARSSEGRTLTVQPVAGAFLGVTVPPDVTRIVAAYRPRLQQGLTWFSTLTYAGLCVTWIALQRRQRE